MEEEETELQNPFPAPPAHYVNYTSHNLRLLALLRSRTAPEGTPLESDVGAQRAALEDQPDVPDWPLAQLERPRADWILEDGHYDVFGERWFVTEKVQSLADAGVAQYYSEDPAVDRRPALRGVLRALLAGYADLLKAATAPPPTTSTLAAGAGPDWPRLVDWLFVMGQNIMGAANDLRPVQARTNLEGMMRRQLELRREETRQIHERCDALEARLAHLRVTTGELLASCAPPQRINQERTDAMDVEPFVVAGMEGSQQTLFATGSGALASFGSGILTKEDVLRWAEEPG